MITKLQAKYKKALHKNRAVQKLYNLNFVKVLEANIMWKFLRPRRGESICDIACGTGIHCIEMAGKGCIVDGVDFNEDSIEMVKLFPHSAYSFLGRQSGQLVWPYRLDFQSQLNRE